MEQHTTMTHTAEIKKLPKSRIEIKATVPAEDFDSTRTEALKHIGSEVELPGFRKGHVPEKVLLQKIGEAALLEEMAEIAIGKAYPKIIVAEKLDVLGRPEIHITKIAHGNQLEFTIHTAVFPEYTLPDYKKIASKIASKKETISVTDKDIEETMTQIRRMRAQQEAQAEGREFNPEATLPEIDDAFVATLGEFTTVDDLKKAVRENILSEKTRTEKDKKRVSIMEEIAKETKMELPEVIIEQELLRMRDEFDADIARMGMDFPAYLTAVKKTEEELREEWRPNAEKRAKIQIIIGKIADTEKIEPNAEKLKQEVDMLSARYPDTDKTRVHSYVHMLLTNEAVFEFLESQSK